MIKELFHVKSKSNRICIFQIYFSNNLNLAQVYPCGDLLPSLEPPNHLVEIVL